MSSETEIVFRFPSKVVQYGYVEARLVMEHTDADSLARRYARAVWEFWQAEDEEVELMRKEAQGMVQEGLGASVMAEEKTPEPGSVESLDALVEATEDAGAYDNQKPWERKPKTAKAKPWEQDKEKPTPKVGAKPANIEW